MLSEQELALLVFVLSSFGVLGYIVLAGVCVSPWWALALLIFSPPL